MEHSVDHLSETFNELSSEEQKDSHDKNGYDSEKCFHKLLSSGTNNNEEPCKIASLEKNKTESKNTISKSDSNVIVEEPCKIIKSIFKHIYDNSQNLEKSDDFENRWKTSENKSENFDEFFISKSDFDAYKLLELANDLALSLSPLEPMPCEMERCDSWEFAPNCDEKNSNFIKSYSRSSKSSSLSSLTSLSEFDNILEQLCKHEICNRKSKKNFANFDRISQIRRSLFNYYKLSNNKKIIRKWHSLNGINEKIIPSKSNSNNNQNCVEEKRLKQFFMHDVINKKNLFIEDKNIFMDDLTTTDEDSKCLENCQLLENDNTDINTDSSEEVNWNWLLRFNHINLDDGEVEGFKTSSSSISSGTPTRTVAGYNNCNNDSSTSSPRQHVHKPMPMEMLRQTSAAGLQFSHLLRSFSVTVRESSKVNASELLLATSSRTTSKLNRANTISIATTSSAAILEAEMFNTKIVTNGFDFGSRSSDNNNSWMRSSMRLVRPFHLADPPVLSSTQPQQSERVTVQLPPIFPCDLLTTPAAVPTDDGGAVARPRQYGRAAERVREIQRPVLSEARNDTVTGEDSNTERISRRNSNSSGLHNHQEGNPPVRNNLESNQRSASNLLTSSSPQPQQFIPFRTYEMTRESESPLGRWNHSLSSMLACLGCTLGIFNISRFAIFSIHFGANFILQFLILTMLIGIPLFSFHMSLGQLLGTGVLDMWHISPIFKGIGIALLLSQAFIGIYSIVGVSWMLVYFRDSFISKHDVYRWAEPLELYGEDGVRSLKFNNGSSYKIEQSVPDYFSGVVLQRRSILKPEEDLVNIKFSVAFNLAIVWIIIFLSLCKGIKSYGKVVYVFSILPIFGMFLLCAKILGFLPTGTRARSVFAETDWNEFFLNSKSWVAAFTEVFLTWGIFGASAMQITSHNKQKHFLHRDASFVIVLTISVLLLSAFLANMCTQLLEFRGYVYLPSSFEHPTTYTFLHKQDIPLPYNGNNNNYPNPPVRWMLHSGLLLGERTIKPGGNQVQESGYQALRLATELVPSTLAVIGLDVISPFWSFLFYLIFILFGISQQLAIWYTVISGLVTVNVKYLKPCWTTITWFICIGGYVMGLPMTTEMGIFVVYFLDYVIGCGWWIMVLYLLELGAVFIVRGRPYSGETIAVTLFAQASYFLQNWIAPMFSFNWNVILPVTLLLLSTSVFKNGGYRMLYNWHSTKFYEYWPSWSLKFGSMVQILPLFLVPLVGIIQTYRYLSNGPPDIFDRIQLLYRPIMDNAQNLRNFLQSDVESNRNNNNGNTNTVLVEDPPPKYTPPPSYSTATGARIAKLLRQSFRRSVRRIAHALGTIPPQSSSAILEAQTTSESNIPPPPSYSTVLVEINNQSSQESNNNHHQVIMSSSSPSGPADTTDGGITSSPSSTLTARDVANILRSSFMSTATNPATNIRNNLIDQECTSIQCLVESAAPINQDSIILLTELKTNNEEPI